MTLQRYLALNWGHDYPVSTLLFDNEGGTPAYIWYRPKPNTGAEPVAAFGQMRTLTPFTSLTWPG